MGQAKRELLSKLITSPSFSRHILRGFWRLLPLKHTNFNPLPSHYLWRMAIQLTVISLHATAVPDSVQSTELY